MRPKLLTALLLTLLATVGQAADLTTLYLGPDGQPLAQGKYWQVSVGFVNGEPVLTKTVLFEVGSGPIPPPPVPDVTAKIKGYLQVVSDPDKAKTSASLGDTYAAQIRFAESGTIKDVLVLRAVIQGAEAGILATTGKTAAWKPWTDGMIALVAPMTFADALAAYRIAQAQLGGGPVPPPPPPTPTAASAMILYESQQMTPAQNLLLLKIRDDETLSKKLQILDKDAKGQKGETVPRVAAAVQAAAGKQLPLLVLFNAAGSVSAVVDLPTTVEAIAAKLKEVGL